MPAIRLEHVSKTHPLRRAGARSLKRMLLALFRRREEKEVVRAADDLSFDIEPGTTLGVVGPNGAGKSTLLRLIAGITEPSAGRIATEGRVLPLLELGAGFHPDLSGQENVFLQGSMFGLERRRVEELFDDIVAFAELEDYIHMPVKQYSSGMHMRLGFSIAVHMDPDILLIDEVFAVGDAYFQRRCVDRMKALHEQGCTLVLVSHDMDLIERVCDEVAWIEAGRLRLRGPAAEVASAYRGAMLREVYPRPAALFTDKQIAEGRAGRYGSGRATIEAFDILDGDGRPRHWFHLGEAMRLRLRYRADEPVDDLGIHISFVSDAGHAPIYVFTRHMRDAQPLPPEGAEVEFRIDRLDLSPAAYWVSALLHTGTGQALDDICDQHAKLYGFSVLPDSHSRGIAALEPQWKWTHEPAAH